MRIGRKEERAMKGIGDYLNLHATALTVRAKRNKVLASNIANAASTT